MITCQRNERVFHISTGKYGTVQVAAKDGAWAVVRFDGTKHGRKVPQAELRLLSRRGKADPSTDPETPVVTEVDRSRFYELGTLCDTCRHAIATDCPYLGANTVEEGIALAGCHVVTTRLSGTGPAYKVVECGRYERGKLPPARWPEAVMERR